MIDPTIGTTVSDVIQKRRSVRRFTEEPISEEDIELILRAGIYAPSGSNWQNQRFLVVSDPDEIKRIGEIRFVWPYRNSNPERIKKTNPSGILGHGTLLVLVFADSYQNDRRGNGEYNVWEALEIQNCSASIQNMLLQATARGIGSCWVSASESMNFTRMLSGKSWGNALGKYDIPSWYKMQGVLVFGHPKKTDDDGYPVGESKHGATIWQSTDRGPTSDYLIHLKAGSPQEKQLSGFSKFQLRIYSAGIRFFRRVIGKLDRWIHKIEVIDFIEPQQANKETDN